MATKNEDLIGETAEALLKSIKEQVGTFEDPESLRLLAEAFAIVSQHDGQSTSGGGSIGRSAGRRI